MESCLKFRSVLLIIEHFFIDQLSGTILLINVNSACTIYQLCVFSFSCDKYERSVVRILIQLWLKSISCYMIDELWVFLYSRGRLFNGLRYCHENCNSAIFLPIYVMLDGFKIVSAMCDRYPPFATLINRIPLFPPRMKKEKKPTQMQAAFSINIAGAAKAHYFYHEFFF